MADYITVQQGDWDDAATITTLAGHSNLADYVHNGLAIQSPDYTNGVFNLSRGKVFVLLDEQYADSHGANFRDCLITAGYDARTGVSFDTTTTNWVYARLNMGTNDSPRIVVSQLERTYEDGILIATIDPTQPAGDRITRHNEAPDGEFEDVNAETLAIGESITYPDGITRTSAPLTRDSVLNNPNDHYDATATDPPGVVNHAEYADAAGRADSSAAADHAADADYATKSGQVGQYTASELINIAEDSGGAWTKLTDQPITDSDTGTTLDLSFSAATTYDRYQVTTYTENHHNTTTQIHARLNNHSKRNYHQMKIVPPELTSRLVQVHNSQNEFGAGDVQGNALGVHTMEFSLPTPVARPRDHYPVMASDTAANGVPTSYELHGHLAVDMDAITSIRLFTENRATGRMTVYGQDI